MASRDLSPLYLTDAQQAQLLMPASELESSLAANYTPAQIQQELIAQQANQQMQPQGYAEGGVIQRFADGGGVLNMPLTGAIQPNIPAASTPAPTVAPAPTISPNTPYTWNPGSTVQNNTTYPTGTVGNYQTMGPTISSTTPYSWSPGGVPQPSNASVIPADNLQALLRTIFPVADPAHYGYGPQTAQVQYHRHGGPIVDNVHAVTLDQGQLENEISNDSSIMSRFDLEKPPPLPKRKPPVPSPFAGAGDPQESDDAGFVPGHAKGGPICIHDAIAGRPVQRLARGGSVMSRFKAPVKQQNFVPKLPHYRDAGLDDGTLSALRSSFRSTIG